MEKMAKPRGRPPKPEAEIKRHNVSLSTTKAMRDRLADAAAKVGRSQSSEIEHRLQMSFALEDDAGGPSVRRLLDFVRLATSKLEFEGGGLWHEQPAVAVALRAVIVDYLDSNRPIFDEVGELDSEELLWRAVQARIDSAGGELTASEKATADKELARLEKAYTEKALEVREKMKPLERSAVQGLRPLINLFRIAK